MKLRAISRFTWRGRLYEIGEDIQCPDDVVEKRLIAEGLADTVSPEIEPAAQDKSESTADAAIEAEVSKSKSVVKTKKKKR